MRRARTATTIVPTRRSPMNWPASPISWIRRLRPTEGGRMRIDEGAILYDTRAPKRRECCGGQFDARCLWHVSTV
jgi:hypothetical protein